MCRYPSRLTLDTVLLDGIDLPFAEPLLLQLAQSKLVNELLPIEADDIVKVFADACQILKFPLDTVLYLGCLGGASHVLLHSRQEFHVFKQCSR